HVCDPDGYKKLSLDMKNFPFCDISQPYAVRVKSLVNSMTTAEKVAQLGNNADGVPRLGLPKYNWWSEALHGVSNAISTEARAMYNMNHAGLTFWSPNINVVRDPRWGRILETPGEDPYTVGRYAVNFVRGMQDLTGNNETSKDPNKRRLKVSACCKHYAAYDLDSWSTSGSLATDRLHFNSDTFQRPFEVCVKEGDVSSVMCSYNSVNGIPACADPRLMKGTFRDEWNLHGYIVSDCDSIETMVDDLQWMNDEPENAVAQVMRAGLDLDCMTFYKKYLGNTLAKGLIKEKDMDRALMNNYMVLMRLGYFDNFPEYANLGKADICSQANINLALDAAKQGNVLLKNNKTQKSFLPLDPIQFKGKTIAIVGPRANATKVMIGNYAGVPCRYVSPKDGIEKYANVQYQMGCADVMCRNGSLIWPAVRAARTADATVIVVGLDETIETEGLDRENMELPGYQLQFITQVAHVASGPVVVVILSAGPVNILSLKLNPDIDSILWAGYPGQEGGQAIADVIFGQYNPAGRLPVTWYPPEYVWQLPMTSMRFRPIQSDQVSLGYPGRTYKFYSGPSIYPFGYGLSYTQFQYTVVNSTSAIEKQLGTIQHCYTLEYTKSGPAAPPCNAAIVDDLQCVDGDLSIVVNVKNTGQIDGDNVVMVYSQAPAGIAGVPIKKVVGFQKVFVKAGATQTVTFSMNSCESLSIVTESAYVALPAGQHTIIIGTDGSADTVIRIPLKVNINKQGS
ncbi:Non-reducing end alpha-L-arabinofuranosidase protein, partial [Dioscorea alata]